MKRNLLWLVGVALVSCLTNSGCALINSLNDSADPPRGSDQGTNLPSSAEDESLRGLNFEGLKELKDLITP